MAEATVKTVQYVDPRIEPQPDPVYDYVIGPTQNQYYKIPASGLSQSSISFNNLTTLGVDRAYLDTFEIELTCDIEFEVAPYIRSRFTNDQQTRWANSFVPNPCEWTFDSFPFNKCCEEARININGGAFFSQPMSYLRAKERYMDQWKLSKCYENLCPCHKPVGQYEVMSDYTDAGTAESRNAVVKRYDYDNTLTVGGSAYPTRLGFGNKSFMQSDQGMEGGFNNSIVRVLRNTQGQITSIQTKAGTEDANHLVTGEKVVYTVSWREPIFCSPFSSRYDATFGRPLYNITSMDLNFQLQDLGNMIRVANIVANPIYNAGNLVPAGTTPGAGAQYTNTEFETHALSQKTTVGYHIEIKTAQICYQVMTIPPSLNKPLTTLVPYRRFVPYITDYYNGLNRLSAESALTTKEQTGVELKSGVYTLNEIPTAIWVFVGPSKAVLQNNKPDYVWHTETQNHTTESTRTTDRFNTFRNNYVTNKQFAFIEHVDLSLANTTQILNTAEVPDLYRIAKANGCQDSYWSWAGYNTLDPKMLTCNPTAAANVAQGSWTTVTTNAPSALPYGCGSVLRLVPGVDIIIPDQALIPGANANNMVFQASVKCTIPAHSWPQNTYSLWLLFEYVGVAAISPGQCEITMNPLGSGEIMRESPILSATSEATEGELEGSGIWDRLKRGASIANHIADEGVLSRILKHIPGAGGASKWLASHGWGEPAAKRKKGDGGMKGGAVIGGGLNEWV